MEKTIDERIKDLQRNYNNLFNDIELILNKIKQIDRKDNDVKKKYNELLNWLNSVEDEIKMLPIQKRIQRN